ncbi:hypothetical protein LQG66_35330 [Bradyrhizobium ontarionense]|uniref:Uncharacterized protein n=1 Tax=Bradyrhizobium ontarionense TaxID=2898149 RepID=A0ABY3RMA6_9BRAD|nr:hypothetical protein [Bradyrhizobium sp. A19]UFZ08635.1 hypothetical protein LQG66_35330 [Bradyrhizobium sp. A19]
MVLVLRTTLRIVCVSTVCFSVFLALGAGFINSALAGLTALVFMSVGLGQIVLEQLALWSTILLIVDRAGLLPIAEWIHGIIAIIGRGMT